MDIYTALPEVLRTYQKAVATNEQAKNGGYGPVIRNPVAWALYVVWRQADKDGAPKEDA